MPDMEEMTKAIDTTDQTERPKGKPRGKHEKPKIKKKKSKTVKRIIILILVLALLGGGAFGVYKLFFTEEERVALTDKTTYGSLDRAIEGSGTTVPLESLEVSLASNTDIEEVYVAAGDYVQVGDLLYSQDDSELDEQIKDLNEEIETYEDEILDYEEGIEDDKDSIEEYTDNIADYQEQISELYEDMAGLTITAPYSGRVTEVTAEVGDNAVSGSQIAYITDDSALELTQYFSYSYQNEVYLTMPAVVSVAEQMLNLDATVTDIEFVERLSADGMRCFAVTVTVENPGSLSEGTAAACYLMGSDGVKVYPAIEGELEYAGTTAIISQVSGELTGVYVSDYQMVEKGQVLFAISSDTFDSQLKNLQKQIENAEKQIGQAYDQIETYEKRIETNKEKIEDTYTAIDEVEETRGEYTVASEIAGKVMYVNIEAGERPGMMMGSAVTVYNLENMTISVNIDELDVDYLYEGMTVTVYRTSAERTTFYDAKITYISPEATSSSGVATFPATIEIYSNGELSAGVNVNYSVNVGDTEESVLVSVSALRSTEDGQNYLFVKADEEPENVLTFDEDEDVEIPKGFYPVAIEVGSSNSYYIRVLSGVEEDTEVFLRYRQTAPSGGDSTSEDMEPEDEATQGPGGGFPDSGGQMPNFGGGNNGGGNGGPPQS